MKNEKINIPGEEAIRIMRLLEFSDSAFPVGAFSFSNGLETATFEKYVYDKNTLEQYAACAARQAAFCDGIAANIAYKALLDNDYETVKKADQYVILYKTNSEARSMVTRMGKKMAEISNRIIDSPILEQWLDDIIRGKTPGTYPVSQAITFALCGLSPLQLFCSHHYGVINMILSAALRCVKVSHFDTQEILYKLSETAKDEYELISQMGLDEMHSFVPQMDIFASHHEKGKMRMFMN